MMIKALFRSGQEWRVGNLEISLLPGLPALHVLGLAQKPVRELLPKFKSAFRAQGLEWPRTRQIVVQVKPEGWGEPVGLDLALAAAIAKATGQLSLPMDAVFCADLSLQGEVFLPETLQELMLDDLATKLVTGKGSLGSGIAHLQELSQPVPQHEGVATPSWQRPPLVERLFSEKAATLLKVVALGEHPILIGGPQGSGKTTWVEALLPLLAEPKDWPTLWRFQKSLGEEISWRPYLAPHHSSSSLAILGGGQPPSAGEVTKAHGGVLFLDEYLEFPPKVQEALREPMEKGFIRVARGPAAKVFPSRFLLVAATNLCHCGKLTPGRDTDCQFSLTRCRTHVERLSGPMLDRFHILALSHQWRALPRTISSSQIWEDVRKARHWRDVQGFGEVAALVDLASLEWRLTKVAQMVLPHEEDSQRRKNATLRIASTLADLEFSKRIEVHHVAQAKAFAVTPYLELGQIFA